MDTPTREGVAVLVWRDGRFLLGLRTGAHGGGTWGLPGGKIDPGESHLDCAARELAEETGLVAVTALEFGHVEAIIGETRWRTYYVAAEAVGEPTVMEPTKHATWRWVDPDDLPQPLFLPLAAYLEANGPFVAPDR